MLTITPIPAFDDNYIWLLRYQRDAIVIDPGDAAPVMAVLDKEGLSLCAILVTHHHADHIGGVSELQHRYQAPTYAPSYGDYAFHHQPVSEGDRITIAPFDLEFEVMWMPGHTNDHVVYLASDLLFCGDVLFSGGCGRLFEGTPSQMLSALQRIATLPDNTQIFCTHEYTQTNLDFALRIEPLNQALIEKRQEVAELRRLGKPSLPSTIAIEKQINPFLRCHVLKGLPTVPSHLQSDLAVFTHIRTLRNHF